MNRQKNLLPPVIVADVQQICIRAEKALKALEGKTVLIAGAAGFLPSYLVHTLAYANTQLFKHRSKIICLDNFSTGTPERLRPWAKRSDVRFTKRDISKAIKVGGHIDFIIHGASIASPVWYRKYPLETIDANVLGTRKLLDLAKEVKVAGFMYFSSSEIYGDPLKGYIPTIESYFGNVSSTGPRACYDESKRLAETLCMVYFRQFSVPIKIIRPFNVYGPGLRLDDGRVVPDFISNVLKKKSIKVFSDGRATRSFCYIADAIVAILLLLTNKVSGEAYNVGNDEEVTIKELAETVNKVGGSKSGVIFAKAKEKAYLTDNPKRRVPDLNKIKRAIKWAPKISLNSGIERTLKFYREGGMG